MTVHQLLSFFTLVRSSPVVNYGYLYVWAADDGTTALNENPKFLGANTKKAGHFIKIDHYQPDMAGTEGFDDLSFALQKKQDNLVLAAGTFKFSCPEDVSTNPKNGLQAILCLTGCTSIFDSVNTWGQTILIEVNFDNFIPGEDIPSDITILYNGNNMPSKDFGICSPDNSDWADDRMIYSKFYVFEDDQV